jgi:hypothetical protein
MDNNTIEAEEINAPGVGLAKTQPFQGWVTGS